MAIQLTRQPAGLGIPLGRYSHVAVGPSGLVAVAGQVGMDEDGNLAGADLASQARQAYDNLGRALASVGCSFSDILKMTTYLVGAELIEEFMQTRTEVYADRYPGGDYPPNTLVMVSRLVEPDLLIEIEAFAAKP